MYRPELISQQFLVTVGAKTYKDLETRASDDQLHILLAKYHLDRVHGWAEEGFESL
jgi:hypothetical protein